ncbi:MAG: 3-dehydroquinate synthase II [Theionarchaea archaeon]|nr:3-dehydroquinate synthase II [Theionarchaea archaeon]MBU7019848.1 3-dehydroquinate synthase II [Theionarchaea archaeon]MBU7035734.1 3-dehydroquinate synthase II [Theionarchaea archaeon]MBU7041827.1 3-dehydroquinate synthase II [Theionarchaea archaeon]
MKQIFYRIQDEFKRDEVIPLLEAGITNFIVSTEEVKEKIEELSVSTVLLERDYEVVRLEKKEDERQIIDSTKEHLFIKAENWKIIPFENLIAQKKDAHLYAVVDDVDEAELLLEVLEKGVDGVVFENQRADDLVRFMGKFQEEKIGLQKAVVCRMENVGSGDRVCVDTTSLFRRGEGLLVGSFARGLFLVHSENVESEWAAPRPFRVNCGAVHCYVLCDGKTKYLSEVRSGDQIKAISSTGEVRRVSVGRSKVERRPLTLVSALVAEDEVSVVVQNAETIRFVTPTGYKSVSQLKRGDELLVFYNPAGRHFGMEVNEFIQER